MEAVVDMGMGVEMGIVIVDMEAVKIIEERDLVDTRAA